jgi:hypothetical protein
MLKLKDWVFRFGQHEHGIEGCPLMAERRKTMNFGEDFLWLADMQADKKEPLYLDTVHYISDFSAEICRRNRALRDADQGSIPLIAAATAARPPEAAAAPMSGFAACGARVASQVAVRVRKIRSSSPERLFEIGRWDRSYWRAVP